MHFRKLDVYRRSLEFLALARELGAGLPAGTGEMRDQLRRAAISIPLNIAEAAGKTSAADQRRVFAIARGSAMECAAVVDVCRLLGGETALPLDQADALLDGIVRMLSRMCR
jgi:four helix bundle protein